MKTKQVLSIEQMKHLQELGLDTSDASMCIEWRESDESKKVVTSLDADTYYDYYHETYTLQDILDKLPKEIKTSTDTYWLGISIYDCKEWYVCYSMSDEFDYYEEFKSRQLIDAAYEMLCWCIENGYVGKEGE
jgi:hypothetical protein